MRPEALRQLYRAITLVLVKARPVKPERHISLAEARLRKLFLSAISRERLREAWESGSGRVLTDEARGLFSKTISNLRLRAVKAFAPLSNEATREAYLYGAEHTREIAPNLEAFYSDLLREARAKSTTFREFYAEVRRRWEPFARHRASLIARTEWNNAYGRASLLKLKSDLFPQKAWQITSPRPCPICLGNAGRGNIGIDEAFPSGHEAPPAHPGCLCRLNGVGGGPQPWRAPEFKPLDPTISESGFWKVHSRFRDAWRSQPRDPRAGVIRLLSNSLKREVKPSQVRSLWRRLERDGFLLPATGTQLEQIISTVINTWMATSADSHPLALALQWAVEDVFQYGGRTNHFGIIGEDGKKLYQRHKAFFQALVKAIYRESQAWLERNGFPEEVYLARGMSFPRTMLPRIDPEKVSRGTVNLQLQPASSFSWDPSVAAQFASGTAAARTGYIGVVMLVKVPRERILAVPYTGFGTVSEREVVVIGGPHEPAQILAGHPEKLYDIVSRVVDFETLSPPFKVEAQRDLPTIYPDDLSHNQDWPKRTWAFPLDREEAIRYLRRLKIDPNDLPLFYLGEETGG